MSSTGTFITNGLSNMANKIKTDIQSVRGMFDKAITKSLIKGVHFMAPSNKLKLASDGDTKALIKLQKSKIQFKTLKIKLK